MKKNLKWKFGIILITFILSIVFLLPNTPFFEPMPDVYKDNFPDKGITLGLDLQGGLHLVFEVEGDRAVALTANRQADRIRNGLKKRELDGEVNVNGYEMIITNNTQAIKEYIEEDHANLELKSEDTRLVYSLTDQEIQWIKGHAMDQALETIRNRIDEFGVAEPILHKQGENEIVVQLPGVKDPKRAIQLIGKTAQLEFKLVDETSPVAAELPSSVPADEGNRLIKKFADKIPDTSEILFQRIVREKTGEVFKRPHLLKKEILLSGELLSDARVAIDTRYNEPYVSITFNSEGSKLFEEVTGKYVKKRLAIVLDQYVYSAPVIQERISGGSAQISGTFLMSEAKDLAIALRAGALPAPVKMLQNVTVGPSLGRDSIEAGKIAGTLAILLVILFMLFYYRFSGLIADLALIFNILLLMGAMAALEATLTLPGIAGVILAIGMAVDTNVLMFERMREELKTGKTPRAAVDSGYDKAFLTIVDSHVTTLITAAVLFQFGTGPIKGFAVTLGLGVAINLFTSLIGTKSVFDLINSRKEIKTLST